MYRRPATIETGTHEFGFEFILPVEAPSSFESPHSYVRYKVKALAKLPSASDKKAETYFSFCQPYDLNRDRAAREYFALRKELSWGLRPLKHGPVTLDLQSASKASVCGALLQIQASVRNAGHSDVTVKVAMKQRLEYITSHRTKYQTRLVWQADDFTCPRDSSDARDFEFVIPSLVPHLLTCNIIRMRYVLQLKSTSKLCKSLRAEAPFYLGTVPLISEEELARTWLPNTEGQPYESYNYPEKFGSEQQKTDSEKCPGKLGSAVQQGDSEKYPGSLVSQSQHFKSSEYPAKLGSEDQRNDSGKYLEALGSEEQRNDSGKYLEALGSEVKQNDPGKYPGALGSEEQQDDSGEYPKLLCAEVQSVFGIPAIVAVDTCFFSSLHKTLQRHRLDTKCPPPNFIVLPK
ncbi:arrestin domain-containing protein 4 [Hyalella azteca]|uniref:Arrestin domain-containing protein 4 n=1 Tax=Hyalella azteca TaxID=294128 RepID=A0A8B7NNL9_HYAAZ|nr:arrestin domain-containing protein 4 [Hyalella azteca]